MYIVRWWIIIVPWHDGDKYFETLPYIYILAVYIYIYIYTFPCRLNCESLKNHLVFPSIFIFRYVTLLTRCLVSLSLTLLYFIWQSKDPWKPMILILHHMFLITVFGRPSWRLTYISALAPFCIVRSHVIHTNEKDIYIYIYIYLHMYIYNHVLYFKAKVWKGLV